MLVNVSRYVGLFVVLVGCGGRATQPGDNPGSGGSGARGGAGGCNEALPGAEPSATIFRYVSNMQVFVRRGCGLSYQLSSSCASPSGPLLSATGLKDCADATPRDCLNDGADCATFAELVEPDSPFEETWTGNLYTVGSDASGCACSTATPAPPGTYTLSTTEFLSEPDALGNQNPFPRRVEFELPAPGGVVTIDLGFTGL